MNKELSKEVFEDLILELSKTPEVTEAEFLNRMSVSQEFARVKNKTSKILATSKLIHYSTRNEKLNKIINKLTNRDTADIISLHTIESHPPSETKPHVDTPSTCTLNILLEDKFEGGEFYLNENLYTGLAKKGDYVVYNGGKEKHSVSKITKGIRKSLIVWYGKSKQLI